MSSRPSSRRRRPRSVAPRRARPGCLRDGRPVAPPSVLVGCGGESTVPLAQRSGRASATAARTRRRRWPRAGPARRRSGLRGFIDTDGSDGGTDVAGAIVDGPPRRARVAGIDLRRRSATIAPARRWPALGDVIETGPTHTNVNDLFVVAIGEAKGPP